MWVRFMTAIRREIRLWKLRRDLEVRQRVWISARLLDKK
jgi:hypothetical protein